MLKKTLLLISVVFSINFIAQNKSISVTIKDDATGLGIPFATIQVKDTDTGKT